jgi:Uma2 family endonuclease
MATTEENIAVVVPADLVIGPNQGNWSYDDYATLADDGQRYEVVDGVLLMAPAPNPRHQGISGRLYFYLYQNIELSGLGRVFYAPLDVQLAPKTVVQPDLLVLLNANLGKITESHIVGAPDLVIEIASPGTAAYDRLSKFQAYAKAGVEEYWIVNPERRSIEVAFLQNGGYVSQGIFQGSDTLPSRIVPGIASINVEQFFP